MSTYLERYLNGEHEQVWAELTALGGQIRQEPLYTDALAVAHETMSRARKNIETLGLRLIELNYEFSEPDQFFVPSTEKDLKCFYEFGRTIGPIPFSILKWYELVGQVDFSGYHKQFRSEVIEPIVIYPIKYSLYLDDFHHLMSVNKPIPLLLYITGEADAEPDATAKILLPNDEIDAKIIGSWQEAENLTFVQYLREVFQCGGFPGIQYIENPPAEELTFLTKDLLPI